MVALWLSIVAAFGAPEDVLWLDAGAVGSPNQPGFVPLTPEGCDDRRVRWHVPPGRATLGAMPDALVGDTIHHGVLTLDLPAGAWHVWAMLGATPLPLVPWSARPFALVVDSEPIIAEEAPTDFGAFLASPAYAHNPSPTFREGESVWDRQVAPATAWRRGRFVSNGQPVRVQAEQRPIAALILAPASDHDAVEQTLLEIDAARRADFHRYHVAPPTPLPRPPADLAWTPWNQHLSEAEPVRGPLSITLVRGERRGLMLWPADDASYTATVDAPPQLEARIYGARWIDRAADDPRVREPRPAWLAPTEGPVAGAQGLSAGLALTLRTAEDAPPGTHSVRVVLGTRVATLKVTILDVDLDPSPVRIAMGWAPSPIASAITGHHSEAVRETIDADLDRMQELGFTGLVAQGLVARDAPSPEASLQQARDVFEGWHARGGEMVGWAGFGQRYIHPVLRRQEDLDEQAWAELDAMLAAADAAPLPVLVKVWEEEGWKAGSTHEQARTLIPALRERAPEGTKLLASMGHPVEVAAAPLFDHASIGPTPTITRAQMDTLRDAGATPWHGGGPSSRVAVWRAWATGASAFGVWHWNAEPADPFADIGPKPQKYVTVLGPDGALWHSPTIEGIADGVMDIRLFTTLQRRISGAALAEVSPRCRARVGEATALLEAVRGGADGSFEVGIYGGDLMDPDAAAEAVHRARDLLAALHCVPVRQQPPNHPRPSPF